MATSVTIELNPELEAIIDSEHKTVTFDQNNGIIGDFYDTQKYTETDSPALDGFTNTVLAAYNTHGSLQFNPDSVAIALCSVINSYINTNSEKFRKEIVAFEGKRELCVELDSFDYKQFSEQMHELIAKNIKLPEILNLYTMDYTTSTDLTKTVGYLVGMATFKEYFKYEFMTMCGIKSVILDGTLEDWNKLLDKFTKLSTIPLFAELNHWFWNMTNVLSMFVHMKQNSAVNDDIKQAWEHVVSSKTTYGSGGYTAITGWIRLFDPFNSCGVYICDGINFNKKFLYKFTGHESKFKVSSVSAMAELDIKLSGAIPDPGMYSYKCGIYSQPFCENNTYSPIIGFTCTKKSSQK